MQKPLTTRIRLITQLTLPAFIFCAGNVQAISLDEAVNRQLENVSGEGPCARLLNAGANPTDSLEAICARAVPVGSTPSSTGGGSATPLAIPNSNTGFIDSAKKTNNKKHAFSTHSGNWDVFFTAENEALDRDASDSEDGFDSSLNRLVIGSSYRANINTAFSLALNMSEHSGDFLSGGDFNFESTGVRLLSSFRLTEKLSLQAAAAYDDVTAERQRNANFDDLFNDVAIFSTSGAPFADYNYDQVGLSARTTYELNFGRLALSPHLGFDWINSDYGTYNEQGDSGLELSFHNDEKASLQSAIGLQGSFAIGTSYGAFIPQFSASWRHEFEDAARNVNVSFTDDANATQFSYQTDELDADFFELSAGSVFVFKNGTQAFINLQTMLSHEVYESFIASAGMRWEL